MDQIIGGNLLLEGHGPVAAPNALLIRNGLIAEIGYAEDLRCRYPQAETDICADRLILPGFIDAHDHGRGLSPFCFGVHDCALELWIPQLGAAGAPAFEAACYDGVLLASSGVTTVVHCHNLGDVSRAADELSDVVRGYHAAGIRVALCPPFIDQNSLIYAGRQAFMQALPADLRTIAENMVSDCPMPLDAYFELIEDLRERFGRQISEGMLELQLHPVAPQWCSDAALVAIAEYAESKGMRIHMHLLETRYQQIFAKKVWGESAVEHLDRLGLLSPRLTCAHVVWATGTDLDLLARRGVVLVTNPSSNLRLRSGVMPLARTMDKEGICSIGLDGCALDDDQDYCRELRMAYFNMSVSGVDAVLTHDDVLQAAYTGGRQATDGRLSAGKLSAGVPADLVCFDMRRLKWPYHDSSISREALVVQKGRRGLISDVFCGGKRIAGYGHENRIEEAGNALSDAIRSKSPGIHRPPETLLSAIRNFYGQWEASETLEAVENI